jgi:hypothetical protein
VSACHSDDTADTTKCDYPEKVCALDIVIDVGGVVVIVVSITATSILCISPKFEYCTAFSIAVRLWRRGECAVSDWWWGHWYSRHCIRFESRHRESNDCQKNAFTRIVDSHLRRFGRSRLIA